MTHWAAKYVGVGYTEAGMCWGLVQSCCLERLGVEMPAIGVGAADDQTAAIKRAVVGWRRHPGPRPLADDVVVMTGPHGPHVGYAVEADGSVGVLHAYGVVEAGRSRGAVVFDPWPEVARRGFRDFEFWRRTQCNS